MKFAFCFLFLNIASSGFTQKPEVFTITRQEISKTEFRPFTSFSDIYPFSEDPDSIAIPGIENLDATTAKHLILKGKYREQFLAVIGISTDDKIFVYDYEVDKLVTFEVKDLNVAAWLNGYSGEDDFPYPGYYYQIGFDLDEKQLSGMSGYFANTFVAFGKESPFERGKMKPVKWTKTDIQLPIPAKAIQEREYEEVKSLKRRDVYTYHTEGIYYTIQEILVNDELGGTYLQMADGSGKIIGTRLFWRSEGTSAAPLTGTVIDEETGEGYNYQWAGKLFKNLPAVMLELEFTSFSCPPIITATKSAEEDIYINCDSRH